MWDDRGNFFSFLLPFFLREGSHDATVSLARSGAFFSSSSLSIDCVCYLYMFPFS